MASDSRLVSEVLKFVVGERVARGMMNYLAMEKHHRQKSNKILKTKHKHHLHLPIN